MNFEDGFYEAYPRGQKNNTRFQAVGGKEIANLVYDAMKKL